MKKLNLCYERKNMKRDMITIQEYLGDYDPKTIAKDFCRRFDGGLYYVKGTERDLTVKNLIEEKEAVVVDYIKHLRSLTPTPNDKRMIIYAQPCSCSLDDRFTERVMYASLDDILANKGRANANEIDDGAFRQIPQAEVMGYYLSEDDFTAQRTGMRYDRGIDRTYDMVLCVLKELQQYGWKQERLEDVLKRDRDYQHIMDGDMLGTETTVENEPDPFAAIVSVAEQLSKGKEPGDTEFFCAMNQCLDWYDLRQYEKQLELVAEYYR